MQIMDPDISPLLHKLCMSWRYTYCFAVKPKASSQREKQTVRPSHMASLAQIHRRFRGAGKLSSISRTNSQSGSSTTWATFLDFFEEIFLRL